MVNQIKCTQCNKRRSYDEYICNNCENNLEDQVIKYLDLKFNADDYNLFEVQVNSFMIEIEERNFMLRITGIATCAIYGEEGGDYGELVASRTNKNIDVAEVELYDSKGEFIEVDDDFENIVQDTINLNL